MTLIPAINNYFGRKEGQSMKEFAAEIRKLTPKDRQDLCKLLTKELGEEVTDEKSAAQV